MSVIYFSAKIFFCVNVWQKSVTFCSPLAGDSNMKLWVGVDYTDEHFSRILVLLIFVSDVSKV